MRRFDRLRLLAILFALVTIARGQGNPGTPSFSVYDTHGFDTINLQNLNVSLTIPIMAKGGALPLSYNMQGGGSYIYSSFAQLYPGVNQAPLAALANNAIGATFLLAQPSTLAVVSCPPGYGTGFGTKASGWHITLGDHTIHNLPATDVSYSGATCFSSFTDTVIDGTGYTLTVTNGKASAIYTKGGMTLSSSSITDSNNNSISVNSGNTQFEDTLGLTAITSAGTNPFTQAYWTDINLGSPTFSATNTPYTLRSAFGCPSLSDYSTLNLSLPTTLTFPDTRTIGLTYETTSGFPSDRTGRLASLTLPSGGGITYNWNPSGAGSSGHYGLNCTYLVPNSITRTTSDGTTTYTWAATTGGTGNTTTVLDNGGNKTVYTFTGLTATGGNAAPPVVQALTQVQRYQGSNTLLTTDVYCYNAASGQPGNCATAVVSGPITELA